MSIPTVVLNEATPAGGDKIREGDDRIREYKTQNREIMDVDHKYDSSGQDDDMGKHNKVSLIEAADIGTGAEGLPILGAQTVDGKAELVFTDEDNNDVQITTGGVVVPASTLDAIGDVAAITEARGQIIYRAAAAWDALTPGTVNLPLLSGGAGADPSYGQIINTSLKTASSEQSKAEVGFTNHSVTGGRYCFWPQYKVSASGDMNANPVGAHEVLNMTSTTYVTNVTLKGDTGVTVYTQFLYVTASGTDPFIYLLLDKTTKDIISASSAFDHPSYGNGGDPEKITHPFSSYDKVKYEIVLLDKETCNQLIQESNATIKEEGENPERSILTILNEDYKPNMNSEETYVPLHSGKYKKTLENGEEVVVKHMIKTIPNYIKVRKLTKLTQVEKNVKKVKQEEAQKKDKEVQAQKLVNKVNVINKLKELGLTDGEVDTIIS